MSDKIAFVSLGCDKNRVDSEVMLGLLLEAGMEVIADEENADVIIVNTCCFIKDALEESIETILTLAEYKKTGLKGLIVCGCLGQRYKEELFSELPEVDAVIGTTAYEQIVEVVKELLSKDTHEKRYFCDINKKAEDQNSEKRILTTAGYYAYLKISEGCDNHCTYCVIPSLRGRHRSRALSSLVREAEALAEGGVSELILIGQDTSIYGRDLYGKSMLPELLRRLSEIDGIVWIRLLYCYPETLTEETILEMAQNKKVCHYIDLPIQHAADSVLQRMGRKSSGALLREKLARLREAMPDVTIRTTLITGFPGETVEEHQALLDFISEIKFEKLGVFTYSREEGTPAAEMAGQVPEEEKERRRHELLEVQKGISARRCEEMVGRVVKVLVDGRLPEEDIYLARSFQDAPDIDGLMFLSSEEALLSGEYVSARVTKASDYDLIGEVCNGDELGE